MRKPARVNGPVGRFDQRLRCASSSKSKRAWERCASLKVASNASAAVAICAVGAAGRLREDGAGECETKPKHR